MVVCHHHVPALGINETSHNQSILWWLNCNWLFYLCKMDVLVVVLRPNSYIEYSRCTDYHILFNFRLALIWVLFLLFCAHLLIRLTWNGCYGIYQNINLGFHHQNLNSGKFFQKKHTQYLPQLISTFFGSYQYFSFLQGTDLLTPLITLN